MSPLSDFLGTGAIDRLFSLLDIFVYCLIAGIAWSIGRMAVEKATEEAKE